MSLTETQVNPLLLDSSYNISDKMFQNDQFVEKPSNNFTETISKRKQGDILSVIRGPLCQHEKLEEASTKYLGR